MNNFELSQLIGDEIGLEKQKTIRVYFGDEFAGLYFGEFGAGFDRYVKALKEKFYYTGSHKIQHYKCHPDFSQDMNTAWVLVEELKKYNLKMLVKISQKGIIVTIHLKIYGLKQEVQRTHVTDNQHLPTVILIAVAKALGVYNAKNS